MTRAEYIALCERKIEEAREELASFPVRHWEDPPCEDEDLQGERDKLHRTINWHQLKLRELRAS